MFKPKYKIYTHWPIEWSDSFTILAFLLDTADTKYYSSVKYYIYDDQCILHKWKPKLITPREWYSIDNEPCEYTWCAGYFYKYYWDKEDPIIDIQLWKYNFIHLHENQDIIDVLLGMIKFCKDEYETRDWESVLWQDC